MTDISREYGSALFILAKEQNKIDEYHKSLALIEEMLKENSEYAELLSSPNISKKELIGLIDTSFSGAVEDNVLSFLKILCEEGHMRLFFKCNDEFNKLMCDDRAITSATITSAVELNDDEKKKLIAKLEKLSGRRVNATYKIDKTLLGGFIVEIDGKILDGSLKKQMQNIKGVIDQ